MGGDVGRFEGAQGLVGGDLLALALPAGRAHQAGGSQLQGVEHESGTLGVDAVVGQGVEYQGERKLHGVHVFEHGKLKTAGFAATAGLRCLHTAGAEVEVEVAEVLAAQGGRITVDAIFFEMVTGSVGHICLLKTAGPLAFSSQLSAVSHQSVDTGCGYSRSKVEQRPSGG